MDIPAHQLAAAALYTENEQTELRYLDFVIQQTLDERSPPSPEEAKSNLNYLIPTDPTIQHDLFELVQLTRAMQQWQLPPDATIAQLIRNQAYHIRLQSAIFHVLSDAPSAPVLRERINDILVRADALLRDSTFASATVNKNGGSDLHLLHLYRYVSLGLLLSLLSLAHRSGNLQETLDLVQENPLSMVPFLAREPLAVAVVAGVATSTMRAELKEVWRRKTVVVLDTEVYLSAVSASLLSYGYAAVTDTAIPTITLRDVLERNETPAFTVAREFFPIERMLETEQEPQGTGYETGFLSSITDFLHGNRRHLFYTTPKKEVRGVVSEEFAVVNNTRTDILQSSQRGRPVELLQALLKDYVFDPPLMTALFEDFSSGLSATSNYAFRDDNTTAYPLPKLSNHTLRLFAARRFLVQNNASVTWQRLYDLQFTEEDEAVFQQQHEDRSWVRFLIGNTRLARGLQLQLLFAGAFVEAYRVVLPARDLYKRYF